MLFLKLNVVTGALRTVGAVICDFIYTIIALLYQLFMVIARLDILQSVDIKPIYQRVTMILTIVMTFYITFEFVKYAISPDTISDKEKGVGNILKRIVIVVIMIAFIPNIFEWGFKLQNRIIETQFISKAIIGKTDGNYKNYGSQFSANVLSLFYYVDDKDTDGACYNDNGVDCTLARSTVDKKMNRLREHGISTITPLINLPSLKSIWKLEVEPAIKFNGIMAIIAGGFMAYILVMYCIDLGVRYFQLLFLQIVAPIAIMGYLLPKKDGIFQKWVKQCITTYIDVFLRIAIMTFVLLLISVIGNAFDSNTIFSTIPEGVSFTLKGLTYVALVMGLLAFAQRAPKLLSELLPSSGAAGIGFGLSGKGRIEPTTKAVKGVAKKATGVVNAGARVAGGVGGMIAGGKLGKGFGEKIRYGAAGAKAGFDKNNKGLPNRRIERATEAAKQRQYKEDEISRNAPAGVNREQAVRQAMYHKEQWANIAAEQDRKSKLFDVPKGSLDAINSQVDEFKQIKALKQELESAKARGASAAEVKTLDAKYKKAAQVIRQQIVANNGVITDQMITDGIKDIEYDQLDANGFATGVKLKMDVKFDSGDRNFSGVVNRVAENELAKIRAAAAEVSDIGVAKVKIGNIEKTINEWIADPNAKTIYAENANKFKDAMVESKSIFENTDEYKAAHAYKDGIDNGGKK